MVRTLEAAAAWVDEVGLALLFPKADVVLPSLWEQVNGDPSDNWSIREPDGTFVRWTDEMGFLWGAKDDLPAEGLVCVGKHVARVATWVARAWCHCSRPRPNRLSSRQTNRRSWRRSRPRVRSQARSYAT